MQDTLIFPLKERITDLQKGTSDIKAKLEEIWVVIEIDQPSLSLSYPFNFKLVMAYTNTKQRNNPKRTKTTQNKPKQTKTIQNDQKQVKTTKNNPKRLKRRTKLT